VRIVWIATEAEQQNLLRHTSGGLINT